LSGVNLQAIYDRLRNVPAYHPMSANTYADWSMEAGDMVTVSRNGTAYKSPVGSSTVKWTGKQQIQIQSEGSRERDPISRVSARKYATGGGGTSGIRANQSLYYEMIDKERGLRGVISATAESLTSDYSKKIEDQNIELRGVVTQTAESLTSDYSMKIGDLDNALRGVIRQTAESLTSDYSNKITETESHFEQRAEQIELSVSNMDKRLSAQIAVTDRTASMSVGRVKYSNTVHYANKSGFPATGVAGTLYYADDTGKAYLYMPGTHSYELAAVDEYGNANYIKSGEIAISINESGNTEAKLDADVIYAGKNTKQTLAGLELPTWMNTTNGLIVEHATILDVHAENIRTVSARCDTLETDYLKTKDLSSEIGKITGVLKVAHLQAQSYTWTPSSGEVKALTAAYDTVEKTVSGNDITLKFTKINGSSDSVTFSKATSLSGAWSGDKFTVTASPQNVKYDVKVTIDQNFTPSGQSSAIKVIKPSASGANWLRVQQQVGDLSSGSRTIKTFVGSTPIEETTITDYNDGFNAVSKPSVTYTDLGDTTIGNVYGHASISDKTDGTTRSTSINLSLSKTTYTPSQVVGAKNCVVVKTPGNVVVGRIDTQSVYDEGHSDGYTAGHNDGYTAGGSTAKVNTVYKIDALPEGKSAIGLSAADSYYQITPAYVNKSGVSVATDNITYIKTPAASTEVTVDNWQRSNFGQDTTKRNSKTLSIPVSVNVNGVTYSNTFTTGSMSLEKYDSTYVNVFMGSTIIARLALFDD